MSFAQSPVIGSTATRGDTVLQIKQLGRVMIPVADQDAAIAFYTEKLGFTLTADVPFGEGDRWVEVDACPPVAPRSRSCRHGTSTRPAG